MKQWMLRFQTNGGKKQAKNKLAKELFWILTEKNRKSTSNPSGFMVY